MSEIEDAARAVYESSSEWLGRGVAWADAEPWIKEQSRTFAKAALASRSSPEWQQHLGWLKLYAEGMTVDNWRDMKARMLRQLAEMSQGATDEQGATNEP